MEGVKSKYVKADPPPIYDGVYEEGVAALNGDFLADRIGDLRAWAINRLACCEAALTGCNGDLGDKQITEYEQEQRTLQAVLRQINGEPTP